MMPSTLHDAIISKWQLMPQIRIHHVTMRLWCSSCATQASSRHSSTLSHSTLGHSNLLGCRKTYDKTSAVLHLPQGSPCSPVALSTEAMAKQQLFPFHPHSTLFKISDWDCLLRVGHTGRFLEISANRKKKDMVLWLLILLHRRAM